jgi:sulfur-carrier protein
VPITFHIPGALREFTEGRSTVKVDGNATTLAEALSNLWALYPAVRDRVVDEQGQVRQHVNIFVGNENVRYTGGLVTKVSDGVEISIVPAVSGGALDEISLRDLSGISRRSQRLGCWLNAPSTFAIPSVNSCSLQIRLTIKYPSLGKS